MLHICWHVCLTQCSVALTIGFLQIPLHCRGYRQAMTCTYCTGSAAAGAHRRDDDPGCCNEVGGKLQAAQFEGAVLKIAHASPQHNGDPICTQNDNEILSGAT